MKPMIIRIVDSMPGGIACSREMDAPAERLSLRTVLTERVQQEVAAYNRTRPEIYRGLVAPAESERLLNGYRLKLVRELDPQQEVDRCFRAFKANGFVVFANGQQVHSLDDDIDFAAAPHLEFVKLMPLAGG
jgi:hypothetical protein